MTDTDQGSAQAAADGRHNNMAQVETFEFSVLGPLRILQHGRAVELGPGRRRAIIAALLVDVGQMVLFETLVERVWDSSAPNKPMASIHTYISRLRGAMRTIDPSGHDAPSPLLTETVGYRLAVDPMSVDSVRFERLLADAQRCRDQGSFVHGRELVGRALALWRGPAYMDVRAPFAEAEAERLTSARERAEELAITLDMLLGRDAAVLPRLEEMVAANPFRESLQGSLMLALYRTGRQADALHRYRLVRNLLADELGIDPGQELRDLHERILTQNPDLDPIAAATAPAPAPGRPDGNATNPVRQTDAAPVRAQLRMVGREAELLRTQERIADAWSGGTVLALTVVGEAGIGKSRLADEIATWAGGRSAVVAWGRCWQHDGAPPLWPWIQVLATLAAATPEDELITALQDRAAPVRALVPDLPNPAETSRPVGEGLIAVSQVQQFDAITVFLEHLARTRPLLLILEDVHWADGASRRMAEYLLTHAAGGNLAIVYTVRAPTEDPGAAGQDLLGALARTGRSERVSLRGMTTSDVREYVRDRTSADLDDVTARALVDRTAGNPFFVGEIVRLLVTDAYTDATGDTTSRPPIPTEVPDTVREVILQRVHRLDQNEQAVLRTAAIAGSSFDLELVEQVSRLADDVVDEAVDSTTAIGFLCSDPAQPGRHRFTHALVQQTIAEDVGPAQRIRLHGRIADVLRHRAGGQPLAHAEDIVYHLIATGTEPNLDLGVELILRLSDAAMARPNYPEADTLLTRALDLVERLSGPTAEIRKMSTLIRLCSLHDLIHGPALPGGSTLPTSAAALRRRALELARRLAGDRDLLAALHGSWALAIGTADLVAASGATDELALVAEATGDERMRLVQRYLRGQVLLQQGRLREAEHNFTAAADAIANVDTETLAAVLSTPIEAIWGWRAITRVLLGDDVGADADLVSNERYIGHQHPSIDVNAAACAAFAAVLRERPEQALPHADHSVSTATTAGLMAIATYVTVFRDWARERLVPGSGLTGLRAGVDAFADGESVLLRPYLRSLFVDVLERSNDPVRLAEASTTLDHAFAEMARNGNELGRPELYRLRARVLRRRGDDTEARREDERAAAATAAQQR